MNVVDSSGWIEYFADEENADFFAEPIEQTRELIVPTVSISMILTTARAYGAELWTQDVDFEGMEGVRYIRKNGNK